MRKDPKVSIYDVAQCIEAAVWSGHDAEEKIKFLLDYKQHLMDLYWEAQETE